MSAPLIDLFDAAEKACASLKEDDPLRMLMSALLDTVRSRLAGADRGKRPGLPDRARFLNKLAPSHRFRPTREDMYKAMDKLLAAAWAPMSSTERSEKLRADEEKRERERQRDQEARAQQRAANPLTPAEKAAETEERYERAANVLSNLQLGEQKQKNLREQIEARLVREARAEDDIVRWQQLCAVFRRCGLERLAVEAVRDSMLRHGVAPILNGPPMGLPAAGGRRCSVLHVLAPFLNREDGMVLQAQEDELATVAAAALGLSRDEAAALHHGLVHAHFDTFMKLALHATGGKPAPACDALASGLYDGCACVAGRWAADLDLAELLHTAPQAAAATLGAAAQSVLCFSHTRFHMRAVLFETLSRIIASEADPSSEPARGRLSSNGYGGMVALLRSSRLGISEPSIGALLSFLGQLEYRCAGRLWARFRRDGECITPQAPRHLCALARGVPARVDGLVTKVFAHSVILREPLRIFFDRQFDAYVKAAGPCYFGHNNGEIWNNKAQMKLDHLLAMCGELLRVAIEVDSCSSSDHLSDLLLLALSQLAHDEMHPARERMRAACFLTEQFAPSSSFPPGRPGLRRRSLPEPALRVLLDAVPRALAMAAVEPAMDVQVKFDSVPKGVLSEADLRAWAERYGEVAEVQLQCQGESFVIQGRPHHQGYQYNKGFVRMVREKAADSFAADLCDTRLLNAKGNFERHAVGARTHIELIPDAPALPRSPTPPPPPPRGPGSSADEDSDCDLDERWMRRWAGDGKYNPLCAFAWAPAFKHYRYRDDVAFFGERPDSTVHLGSPYKHY